MTARIEQNARGLQVIDLFAGGGGMSTGARMAGADVAWAANHSPVAVAAHAANHPDTDHSCQDLQQANFFEAPDCDILLASPCCQGHSKAKGKDTAAYDASRATAWAVCAALEAKMPKAFVVENVEEMQNWGPLKRRDGTLYRAWFSTLEALGYRITTNMINSADLGVPQSRNRMFLVGTLDSQPIEISQPREDHVAADTIIDWDAGEWGSFERTKTNRARSVNSLAQVERGAERHGDRFAIAFYGSEKSGRSTAKPMGTLTCKHRFDLVDMQRGMRGLSLDEMRRAMGFPEDYQLARTVNDSISLLGNAVVPQVAAHVVNEVALAL